MKRAILSDSELTALDWELRDQLDGKLPTNTLNELVRPKPNPVFPLDGYLSWQHRWLMGTGVRPKGW